MFKKRLAGNKRTFKASELELDDKKEAGEVEKTREVTFERPTPSFKKRKTTDKLNSVSTKV